MDTRQRRYFDNEVRSIFDEFRDLLNKLEERVQEREKQVKREVRAQILSSLESICENYFSETVAHRNNENGAFLEVLKSKLNSEECDSSDYRDGHCNTNATCSLKFEDDETKNTLPLSIKSDTSNDSVDGNSDNCQTTAKTGECDDVMQMVVALNPTQFIDEPFASEDDNEDSDDTPETMVPKTQHRQAVEKREYKLPLHTVNSSNQCPFCGQYFSQRNSLKRHIRSHTGERPFPCEYCGKSFIDKERLKVHIRIHTGEKPFSCDVCGRNFTQKSTVKRHMSVHTGDKPYHCEHCGKQFGSKDNLKVHIKSHTRTLRFIAGDLNSEISQ